MMANVAQTQTTELTCQNLVIPLSGLPEETGVAFELLPEHLTAQCKSVSGSKITLSSPEGGLHIDIPAQTTKTYTFTVKDKIGNTTSAQVIISRE